MATVERLDDFKVKVTFAVPAEEYDKSCFISGNFNCSGDGSVALERDGNFWTGSVVLQPGDYEYFVEIDQYYKCDEKRKVRKKPVSLRIKQERFYHDPANPLFYWKNGGKYLVKCISPVENKNVSLILGGGKNLKPFRVERYTCMNLFQFVLDRPESYSFEVDGRKHEEIFEGKEIDDEYVDSSIIYQIFPDRFNIKGEPKNINAQWNERPKSHSVFGGNLQGIIEKIDYIRDLGAGHIYLNPVYKSTSNHRYNVDDYYQIDPVLGNMSDLLSLSDAMKERGMFLIFDIVFNHTSTNFQPFVEAINNGDSPFREWYYFLTGKNNTDLPYECFKNHLPMPKLRISNPEVSDMIMDVLQYYGRSLNISFFRYDVADSMDINAMAKIIDEMRKKLPNIRHMAEVWCNPFFFTDSSVYDSAMNYEIRDNIISMLMGKISMDEFVRNMDILYFRTGEKRQKEMMNLVGSHDTPRIRTVLGSKDGAMLSYAILYMLNGIPSLYYGDETGLEGGEDPDCRRTFPWESVDEGMVDFFKTLKDIRSKNRAAFDGILHGGKEGDIMFIRKISRDNEIEIRFSLKDMEINMDGDTVLSNGIYKEGKKIKIKKFGFFITAH